MIRITRNNGMTNIDVESNPGIRNLSCCYIDNMYQTGDGFGIQHNHFGAEKESRILELCDIIHNAIRELDELNV